MPCSYPKLCINLYVGLPLVSILISSNKGEKSKSFLLLSPKYELFIPGPVEGVPDCLFPAANPAVSVFLCDAGIKHGIYTVFALQFPGAVPEADCQTGKIRGALCRRLHAGGSDDAQAADIRLCLHQEVVPAGPAVHHQLIEALAGLKSSVLRTTWAVQQVSCGMPKNLTQKNLL